MRVGFEAFISRPFFLLHHFSANLQLTIHTLPKFQKWQDRIHMFKPTRKYKYAYFSKSWIVSNSSKSVSSCTFVPTTFSFKRLL